MMPNADEKQEVLDPTSILTVSCVEFDTHKIERDIRYEAWQENISAVFDVTPTDNLPLQDYQAKLTARLVGEAFIAQTSAPAQRFSRDRVRVWREEKDVIFVQLFLRGSGIIASTEKISAGDMLVIDMNQTIDVVLSAYENLTLALPGHLAGDLAGALEKLHGRSFSSDNPMVRLMGDHLRCLWHHLPAMDRQQADIAIQGTLGLLQSWLAENSGVCDMSNPAVEKAVTTSIHRYIEQNLDKPLHIETLSQTFNMSRAQLYRVFKPYGGVKWYIWERRLQRSLRMLSQPRFANMTIAAIAFACGFSSEVHFSRKFREAFGITPGQARLEALGTKQQHWTDAIASEQYPTDFRHFFETFSR